MTVVPVFPFVPLSCLDAFHTLPSTAKVFVTNSFQLEIFRALAFLRTRALSLLYSARCLGSRCCCHSLRASLLRAIMKLSSGSSLFNVTGGVSKTVVPRYASSIVAVRRVMELSTSSGEFTSMFNGIASVSTRRYSSQSLLVIFSRRPGDGRSRVHSGLRDLPVACRDPSGLHPVRRGDACSLKDSTSARWSPGLWVSQIRAMSTPYVSRSFRNSCSCSTSPLAFQNRMFSGSSVPLPCSVSIAEEFSCGFKKYHYFGCFVWRVLQPYYILPQELENWLKVFFYFRVGWGPFLALFFHVTIIIRSFNVDFYIRADTSETLEKTVRSLSTTHPLLSHPPRAILYDSNLFLPTAFGIKADTYPKAESFVDVQNRILFSLTLLDEEEKNKDHTSGHVDKDGVHLGQCGPIGSSRARCDPRFLKCGPHSFLEENNWKHTVADGKGEKASLVERSFDEQRSFVNISYPVQVKLAQTKTTYLLFRSVLRRNPILNVSFQNVKRSRTTMYLGVTLEGKQNFDAHMKHVCGRAKRRRFHPPMLIIKTYHEAIIVSLVSYGASAWAHILKLKTHIGMLRYFQRSILLSFFGVYLTT
uniref:Uncharacterized protein n=1 Tax=Timema monikensis TaxID=170555 RepID=A0A7R9HPW5_9NEOP|nr:unnamed protein product [Timema monikensis]